MLFRNRASGRVSSAVSAIFGIALLLISLLLWLNKQLVTDIIANWQYRPTAAIVQLADRTTMTDLGKFYFYASKPVLENTQAFNKECERKEATSAILGCYTGANIYLYDVTDEQLDGIREVTAAHETLHAAYDRLSQGEKEQLRPLFVAEYEKRVNDKDLSERMAFYDRNEAGEQDNELHSIIGTEFKDIDPRLEEHYKKYFSNRQAVVELYAKYRDVFKQLQSKTEVLSTQLTALSVKITAASKDYNDEVNDLNAAITAFNKRAENGDFASREQFERERNTLVAKAAAIEQSRGNVQRDIAEYERLRAQYNEVADASKKLYDSIDSNLAPAPAL
jgi:uncharacterized phage infection (PIP) family protein YhgE